MNCLYQLRTNIMFTKSDSFLHVSSSNTGLNDILHVTYFFHQSVKGVLKNTNITQLKLIYRIKKFRATRVHFLLIETHEMKHSEFFLHTCL